MASNTAGYVTTGVYRHTGFWRLGVKALVGGVLFGIVMVLVQQVTERADTALTGGAFLIFGGITWAAINGIATQLCRQPGGMITGVIQALIAILTALTPLAPILFVVNIGGSLAYSAVAVKLPMSSWAHQLLAQIAANVVGNILVSIGLLYILNLPLSVVVVSSGVTAIAGIIGGTILTKLIADAVAKSGVMD